MIKPLKSEAIHKTGLSGYVVASFFPLIIFILFCFNVLSTVPRENRLVDFLHIYIYIKVAADYNRLLLYNRREKAKITMGVDVLMKDNEAVGVNILTKVYCSGEASDILFCCFRDGIWI